MTQYNTLGRSIVVNNEDIMITFNHFGELSQFNNLPANDDQKHLYQKLIKVFGESEGLIAVLSKPAVR